MQLGRPERQTRRANSAIEFALILPILLALTLPVIELSWYFLIQQSAVEAVQTGARAGASTWLVDGPEAVALSVTNTSLAATLPAGASTPATSATLVDADATILVEVTVPYTSLTGFITLPSGIYVKQRMRIEHE